MAAESVGIVWALSGASARTFSACKKENGQQTGAVWTFVPDPKKCPELKELKAELFALTSKCKEHPHSMWRAAADTCRGIVSRLVGDASAEGAMNRLVAAGLQLLYGGGRLLNCDAIEQILVIVATEAGHGTGLHIDPAGALNVAAPYGREHRDVVLAVWLFISPLVFANEVLTGKLLHAVFEGTAYAAAQPSLQLYTLFNKLEFTPQLMEKVKVVLGSTYAFVVEQKAGQVVIVLPGWAHVVYNKYKCTKVAVEKLGLCETVHVLQMQQRVRSCMPGEALPADYMQVGSLVCDEVEHWCNHLGC